MFEALKHLLKLGKNTPETVYTGDGFKKILVYDEANKNHEEVVVTEYCKETFSRQHKFADIETFVSFLKGPLGKPNNNATNSTVPVFISSESIVARLSYGNTNPEKISVPLGTSPEISALISLFRDNDQGEVWDILIKQLRDSIDPALIPAISGLKLSRKIESKNVIGELGVSSTGNSLQTSISIPGAKGKGDTKIKNQWKFNVPIFSCRPDTKYDVETTLLISVEEGELRFSFSIIDQAKIMRQATKDLIEHVKKSLGKEFAVYQGTL